MPSISATGSSVMGAPETGEAQDAHEGADPKDSPTTTVGDDGVPAPDTTTGVEAMASLVTSGVATGDPTASTGLAACAPRSPPRMAAATTSTGVDDNIVEEPEVIMGLPGLRAPGTISLSEAMGMTHFALNQAHDVLRQESEDINEEWLHLLVWVSLLKQWTTSKKEKAEAIAPN
jgi:hypothetical protein